MKKSWIICLALFLAGLAWALVHAQRPVETVTPETSPLPATPVVSNQTATVILAGGCFWCLQPPFDKTAGVLKVRVGYSGGRSSNPTYQTYADQDHIEVVEVTYDPSQVHYRSLLEIFWRQIDPTDPDGQFVDRGPHYRTAIFYQTEQEKRWAEESKAALAQSGRFTKPLVTEILPARRFHPAETYHQDYYKKNPAHYQAYRTGSGRERFLKRVWGNSPLPAPFPPQSFRKPTEPELRARLTPLQFKVTQQDGTEPPFTQPVLGQPPAGHLRRHCQRRSTFQLPRQVRLQHRLAQLHPPPGTVQHRRAHR